MANKYFNVKTGIRTGNIVLDADSGNANIVNINVARYVMSNLHPGRDGVLSLGNATNRYQNVFISDQFNVNGQSITANVDTTIFSGNVYANGVSANTVTVNNQLIINSNTDSTTTTTGTFITAGGVGIAKDLTVGGNVQLADSTGNAKGLINYNDTSSSIDFRFKG
jgi:hypothetical protein